MSRVSVVIPFYNANEFLCDTLVSIRENASLVKEVIIVVDRGSESPIVPTDFSSLHVRLVDNTSSDKGAGVCRAMGYNLAEGDFVAFLDADDLWGKGKLDQQLKCMEEKNLAFSFHPFRHFSGDKMYPWIRPSGAYSVNRFFSKGFVIGCLTVMVDRRAVPVIKPNTLTRRNDYFMWYEIIKYVEENSLAWGGVYVGEAYHRLHSGALTSSKLRSLLSQITFYRKCELSVFKVLYYLVFYIYRAIGTR